ncbi:MAG: DUF4956 domain-containing protein [Clostridiales bacterium]|jgi:uncharacterized membrane protein YhiD involved in acid resistance|nr:DUF4956 domain-containing protein [Clostridiales bacterium]OPZ70098.1 MAG: hypothetical protein BWY81_00100 [Firmicutes bacterium ADurb.Bin467]
MNSSAVANLFASQTIAPGSWPTILFSILLAFAVGLAVAWVYRANFRGVMYSSNFSLTLVLMTLITTPVVMCIRDSIQLSMGMVGALSIVRFRTAVKDPLDTAYMFWALTMGILLGAGQFFLTGLTVAAIAILISLVSRMQTRKLNSYLLVLRMSDAAERAAAQVINTVKFQRLRTKTVQQGAIEATYEVRLEKTDALLKRLTDIPGVQDATLVVYTGEGA